MANWHPNATKVVYTDAGPFIDCPPKIVWHTTEGSGLPTYSGSAPHFTFDPLTGALHQHVPLNRAAKSLEHPAGTAHTNLAHAIQVELRGYSDEAKAKQHGKPKYAVVNWGPVEYQRIARLARWIEQNADVPSVCSVKFGEYPNHLPPRLSSGAWINYRGHLGHQHVPGNHHGDPSSLRIDLILADSDEARKKARWARSLEILRAKARIHGWRKAWRVRARKLKRLIGRKP